MCGRFTQRLSWREVHELMSLLGPARNLRPRYNVAPAQTVAVVRAGPEGRMLSMLRWGLIPAWAKESNIGYKLINARAGTAHEKPSFRAAVAKAMDYMLKRWDGFARFLDDGRICLTNNAAERALRPLCLGRKSWLFAGSDRGGERAAAMYTLIGTAKLNDADPQAWLADVLARIAELPQTCLHELLPWNWKPDRQQALAA